jgi:predicted RND superfamily exporter protein
LAGTPTEGIKACDGIIFHQSRFVQTTDVGDAARASEQIDEARALVDGEYYKELGLYPYGRLYQYNQQFQHIRENARLLLIVVTLVATIIIAVLFLSVPMGFIQGFTLTCALTCMAGFIPAFDLQLNAVSLLCILFGLRKLVQHIVLICRIFDSIQEGSRAERAVEALARAGGPVLCGTLTSFLCNTTLQVNDATYLKEYFFQFHSLVMLISLFFIWTLLPLLLAFFGPRPVLTFTVDRDSDPVVDDKPQPVPAVGVEDLPDAK